VHDSAGTAIALKSQPATWDGVFFMGIRSIKKLVVLLVVYTVMPCAVFADTAAFPVEEGFLSVAYEDMRVSEHPGGFDLTSIAPGAFEKLADYDGIIIDQPEIWIDPKSNYLGTQPEYLRAMVELVRGTLVGQMLRGGNNVVEIPGPNVLFMRVALTDLHLKKKKGQIVAYQPIGSVSDEELLQTLMKKVDILEFALQMELVDSQTEEFLGAIVIRRGELKKGRKNIDGRLDFAEFWAIVDEYANRVRCRFDNAKRPKEEWKECLPG
jgi:hypothetical protein